MKKRYVMAAAVLLLCAFLVLTGFDNAGGDAKYLLSQRTGVFKLLQYGELTQEAAREKLYEIETGKQLEADLEYIDSFSNTEICRIKDMYIKSIERTSAKSGYEVYSAVIDWRFENGIYESISYVVVIKKTGHTDKIARITVQS